MKLTELSPRWIGLHGWSSPSPFYVGVTFECPHCRIQRLAVMFSPPINPDNLPISLPKGDGLHWQRSGDNFETLTLSPSIDASGIDVAGHWHGFIQNGEIR